MKKYSPWPHGIYILVKETERKKNLKKIKQVKEMGKYGEGTILEKGGQGKPLRGEGIQEKTLSYVGVRGKNTQAERAAGAKALRQQRVWYELGTMRMSLWLGQSKESQKWQVAEGGRGKVNRRSVGCGLWATGHYR